MPEVYSMSRWAKPSKFDKYAPPGDKVVRSIKRKHPNKPKAAYIRGCPKNNYGAHFYVGHKFITVHVDDPYRRDQVSYSSFCLLCGKYGKLYSSWRGSVNPPSSLEVIDTKVHYLGRYVKGNLGWYLTSDKVVSYDGETDKNGAKVERY